MMRGYGLYHGAGLVGGGIGMVFVWLLWLLIVIGIVMLVVRMVRRSGGHMHGGMTYGMHGGAMTGGMPTATPAHDEAVTIARKRFASGEINKEQFDELMKSLG